MATPPMSRARTPYQFTPGSNDRSLCFITPLSYSEPNLFDQFFSSCCVSSSIFINHQQVSGSYSLAKLNPNKSWEISIQYCNLTFCYFFLLFAFSSHNLFLSFWSAFSGFRFSRSWINCKFSKLVKNRPVCLWISGIIISGPKRAPKRIRINRITNSDLSSDESEEDGM